MQQILATKKIRINTKAIIPFLGLFIFAHPFIKYLFNLDSWGTIENWMIVTLDCWIGLQMICRPVKKTTVYMILLVAVFFAWPIVPTLMHDTSSLRPAIKRFVVAVSFVLLLEYLFSSQGAKRAVSVLMPYMETINYVNLLYMLLFPNGLYHTVNYGTYEAAVRNTTGFVRTPSSRVHWLLGHQTTLIRFILPAIVVGFIYSDLYSNNGKLSVRTKMLFLVCVFEVVIANSATNYLALAILFISYLLIRKKLPFRPWYLIPIVFFGYLFLIREHGFETITTIMSSFLSRDVNLTTRTLVWVRTISAWLKHPFLGVGYLDESSAEVWRVLGNLANPHSTYPWILYEGGIVGLMLFVLLYAYSCRSLIRERNKKTTVAIFAGIIAMVAAMITDDYIFRSQFMLILFVISFHASDYPDADSNQSPASLSV